MTEGSSMMYHGSGGFGGGAPVYMVGGPAAERPRQYPLELMQYVGGLVERGAAGAPGPLTALPPPPPTQPKADNNAFGYESDDSSLSSNASGSNKSSDKGDNTSHTSEMSCSSSNSALTVNNNIYYDNNNNGYNTGYHDNNNAYNFNNSREWRGRNRRDQNRPRRIAPDRYLNSNYPFQVKFTPDDLLNGSKWDTLSQEIWDKFIKAQQTEETFRKKMNLWRYLYVTIKSVFPRYGLYVVGSTMSGFALDRSDVDLCLHVRGAGAAGAGAGAGAAAGAGGAPRAQALLHLGLVLQLVRTIDPNAELIQAKVPIVKFGDARLGLRADLNCNNVVGVRNTNLLYCYCRMDWRVRPLVVVAKLWAAAHDINDARRRTLASYSLTLMVIHFLQCGVSPAVLGAGRARRPHNRMSLGELFLRMLHYYAHFPFSRLAVSVRCGRAVPLADCRARGEPAQWKLLCVEEPFDLSNTARSVYDPDTFQKIVDTFRRSYQRLSTGLRLEDAWPSEPR